MNKTLLSRTAVFCRILSLFPFAVLTAGAGIGEYVWWHYIVFFAMIAAFYAAGYLAGKIIAVAHFPKAVRPAAVFVSRAAVLVPVTAFILAVELAGLPQMLYMYALPAGVIAYFSGYRAFGLEYSDLFSMGWFALFFVSAVMVCLMLRFSHVPELYSPAMLQLCLAFGLLIVIASLLANQTNIDQRTRQRAAGKSVLPRGLRGYNASLIAGISIATVSLFLLAKPLSALIIGGIAALIRLILMLIRSFGMELEFSGVDGEGAGGSLVDPADNTVFTVIWTFSVLIVGFLLIYFRRQILQFFRELIAPLFRESKRETAQPFADEISDSLAKSDSARARRRTEQLLLRQFRRETDGRKKYRLGYKLFMLRLARSAFPPLPADTTSIHSQKAEAAFRRPDTGDMVNVYNEVRYGGMAPSAEQLRAQERMIDEIK